MNCNEIDLKDHTSPLDFRLVYNDLISSGFSIIKEIYINPRLIEDVYFLWRDFFNSKKNPDVYLKSGQKKPIGYYNYWSEDGNFKKIGIPKESFYFKKDTKLLDNVLLENKTLELFNQLSNLAMSLLESITSSLPQHASKSIFSINQYDESLRIIHSPPIFEKDQDDIIYENLVRNREHEDIDLLTLLPSATVPGLQFLNNHLSWETVNYNFGDIIINAGDTLNLISSGIIKSATHRVVCLNKNDAKISRLSMAYFIAIK